MSLEHSSGNAIRSKNGYMKKQNILSKDMYTDRFHEQTEEPKQTGQWVSGWRLDSPDSGRHPQTVELQRSRTTAAGHGAVKIVGNAVC